MNKSFYEQYFKISSNLDIVSARTNKVMSQHINRKGYFYVSTSDRGKGITVEVHRLIALYLIPNPSNLSTVNHINGIKTDNTLANLEWLSYKENTQHALKNGLLATGCKNGMSALSIDEIALIKEFYIPRDSVWGMQGLADMLNVSRSTVSRILNNLTYKDCDK